jgi:hypothetical protein
MDLEKGSKTIQGSARGLHGGAMSAGWDAADRLDRDVNVIVNPTHQARFFKKLDDRTKGPGPLLGELPPAHHRPWPLLLATESISRVSPL